MRRQRSDKGRSHLVRKPRVFFEPRAEGQKHAPDSLRFVLIACRQTFGSGTEINYTEFSRILTDHWPSDRLQAYRFNRKFLGQMERGQQSIEYVHLEAYARAMSVPAGLLLLISRAIADREEYDEIVSTNMLSNVIKSLQLLRDIVSERPVTKEDIFSVISDFARELGQDAES